MSRSAYLDVQIANLCSETHLCARITGNSSGSPVMLDVTERSTLAARAASFVLGAALATGVAKAQTNSVPDRKALVSGRFTDPKGDAAPPGSQVVFVANGASVLRANKASLKYEDILLTVV
jgi:hypothetical protein